MWSFEDFKRTLNEQSDQDLFDVLAHSDDYRPEAIEAVKAELHRRNLSEHELAHLDRGAKLKVALDVKEAAQPLNGWMWLLCFISSGLIGAGVVIALHYTKSGHKRKAKDAWIAWGCGLIFWFWVYHGMKM